MVLLVTSSGIITTELEVSRADESLRESWGEEIVEEEEGRPEEEAEEEGRTEEGGRREEEEERALLAPVMHSSSFVIIHVILSFGDLIGVSLSGEIFPLGLFSA
jgi:hypothetical protein